MRIRFTKMQGLGNDFVVLDALRQRVSLDADKCRLLANRRFGVGCDQVLLVERARSPDTDLFYRIFNADGSEAEQCGNGARCFARFVRDKGLTNKDEISVGTKAGDLRLYLEADGQVRVSMGVPSFEPARIPFLAEAPADTYPLEVGGETISIGAVSMGNPHAVLRVDDVEPARIPFLAEAPADTYPLEVGGETISIGAVSMGNPHAVLRVEDVEQSPVNVLGPLIERHPRFPKRVNAGFMQVLGPDHIRLRVFERGVGETLACGTGACAAVAVGRRLGLLAERVRVSLPGGDLVIEWSREPRPLWMTGPAVSVYEGEIDL